MRKLKEVLRLHSLGLSQHQIARSCSISQSTVHDCLSAAQAAGLKWPLPENWGDQQIEQVLFPNRPAPAVWRKHPEPDWTQIHKELQTHKNLTLQLVWQEGRENNPEGYAYSRFCDLYRRWLKKLDLVLRQEHRAGEKMFVDYAGATIPVYDPESGEARPAAVFVAVLGASSYTFAEATAGQDLRNWIGSHQRAFEFFGGVVEVVVPDNPEVRRHASELLRTGPQPHVPRPGRALRRRHYSGAAVSGPRQGQGGGRSSGGPALDRCGPAQAQVLLPG